LLALLALRHGDEVERAWVAGTLWPDSPEAAALANLRNSLTDLRQALGPEAARLRSPTSHTLGLDLAGAAVDVIAFDQAIQGGDAPALETAVGLYRGPLLEGWTEEWVFQERQARLEAYLTALETLAAQALGRGEYPTAERHLRRAAAADPLRESAQRALMQRLAASGNYAAATQVYRELRLLLHREINAGPDAETQALFTQLRAEARQKAVAGRQSPVASKVDQEELRARPSPPELAPGAWRLTSGTISHHLPLQLTSFIGREDQISEVTQLLASYRLVTLTGAGGCGKTRLALQVAAELLESCRDGVWLAELAPLADPGLVPQAVATVLGVQEAPGRSLTQTLIDSLKARQVLLLLDNCEHLVGACAQLAETLLRSCPKLRILATSREPLGIGGETTYRVPSLSLPPAAEGVGCRAKGEGSDQVGPVPPYTLLEYEATRLFSERAVTALPAFRVAAANARAVAAVCRRLDGIPLAIELAAARVRALPVEQIAARLDDMFRLLTGTSRTALPRHKTLRALIDWSYDLLSEGERTLLRRLSVFAGGWTLAAAEAVCSDFGFGSLECGSGPTERSGPPTGPPLPAIQNPNVQRAAEMQNEEVLDLLTSLVDKSLVVYDEQGGEGRYRLLETVRQYARDRLLESGEAEAMRPRHADFFLQLGERAEPELFGADQLFWRERLEAEHDNLRAALTWLGSAEERAQRGTSAWGQLRLAGALWRFWFGRGSMREGREWAEAALSRGQHAPAPLRAKALGAAGILAYSTGDYAVADALLEESVAVARAAGEKSVAAHSLFQWALLAISQGEYARATARAQESLTLAQDVDDPLHRARPLHALSMAALHQGDTVAAGCLLDEYVALLRSRGARGHIDRATAHRGAVALAQGEREEARALYREALMRCQETADKRAMAACLCGLAAVAVPRLPERAAWLFGAAEALREALGSPYLADVTDPAGYDEHVAALRARLDEERLTAAWTEGRGMTLEQAVRLALEDDE
jgi:non-specific serine/threonine protein kinase